jgi:hypothetical protein
MKLLLQDKMNNREVKNKYIEKVFIFIPLLTDSKTPTSRFKGDEEEKWEINCP